MDIRKVKTLLLSLRVCIYINYDKVARSEGGTLIPYKYTRTDSGITYVIYEMSREIILIKNNQTVFSKYSRATALNIARS